MKKITNLFLSSILVYSAFSQDVIYKADGGKIDAKVIEITVDAIKYKAIEDLEGPLRNIPIYGVYMIKYENGKEEFFKTQNQISDKNEKFYLNKKDTYYISIAPGFGQSYGGLGIRLQGRLGEITGFGYHAGVGYYPKLGDLESAVWFSIGTKFFWYKGWYFDLQFGSVAQWSKRYYSNYNGYYSYYEYGTAYGPSVLIGGDWFFNKYVGMNGALGIAINLTKPELPATVFPTFDIGIMVKF